MTGKVKEPRLCKSGAFANLTMRLEATYVDPTILHRYLEKTPYLLDITKTTLGHQDEGNHNRNIGT